MAKVRQLRLIVVPFKFRQVVMSTCHVSTLAGHSHEQKTLFRILALFWWPMVNREVAQFIRASANFLLENSCSHEANQLLQTIDSDNPFDVVFIDLWEPGDIPDWDGSLKILTCLDCMTGSGIGAATGLKEITSYQAIQWDFGNFFFTFWPPEMIVVDVKKSAIIESKSYVVSL